MSPHTITDSKFINEFRKVAGKQHLAPWLSQGVSQKNLEIFSLLE